MTGRGLIVVLLGWSIFLQGCAAVPSGGGALTPPGVPPLLPPGANGATNVVVPNNINVHVTHTRGSLPEFLGFPRLRMALRNLGAGIYQLGARMFPALATANPQREPGAPLLPLNDPSNLNSSSPAVQSAAKVKMDEDQAAQKIKALKYLATVGCGGCYPDVEDAFLAALDDCTEAVRYAAVMALKDAAGHPCTYCSNRSCCSFRIREKLTKMTEEADCFECAGEPSPRVRRVARIALINCGMKGLAAVPDVLPDQIEGPTQAISSHAAPGFPTHAATTAAMTVPATADTTNPQLVSHEQFLPAATDSTADEPIDTEKLQRLAAQWLEEIDPSLSLDEKRDLLRKKTRNFLKSRNERDILLGDVLHELQVQQQLQSSQQPAPPAVAHSSRNVAGPFPVAAAVPAAPSRTYGLFEPQRPVSASPAAQPPQAQRVPRGPMPATVPATANNPTSPPAIRYAAGHQFHANTESRGALVRWESVVYLLAAGESPVAGFERCEQVRRYLSQQPGATAPNDEVRTRLRAHTVDWADTRTISPQRKRNVLETLPVGQVSEAIEVDGGWEILRILQRKTEQPPQ